MPPDGAPKKFMGEKLQINDTIAHNVSNNNDRLQHHKWCKV